MNLLCILCVICGLTGCDSKSPSSEDDYFARVFEDDDEFERLMQEMEDEFDANDRGASQRLRSDSGDGYGTAAVSPDGATLALGGNQVDLWDLATAKRTMRLTRPGSGPYHLVFLPGGKRLLATYTPNELEGAYETVVWDLADEAPVLVIDHLSTLDLEPANSVAISPDGRFALIGGRNPLYVETTAHASMVDLATGNELRRFDGESHYEIEAVDISGDARRALVGDGRRVAIYDIESGSLVKEYVYTDLVVAARFIPNRDSFAVCLDGPRSNYLAIQGVEDESLIRCDERKMEQQCLAVSSDGSLLLSSAEDGVVTLRTTDTGELLHTFPGFGWLCMPEPLFIPGTNTVALVYSDAFLYADVPSVSSDEAIRGDASRYGEAERVENE